MLKLRHEEQYDASDMTWAWWRANIKHQTSKISVTCKRCGHRSRGTSLASLQSGQAPGCLCSRKTEAKLRRWLCAKYPDWTITSQVKGCTNPDTQRPLPFDFGVYHDTILIELDGEIRHFGRGWGGVADDGGVPQRDFFKEYWASDSTWQSCSSIVADRCVRRFLALGGLLDSSDPTCNMFGQALCTHAGCHAVQGWSLSSAAHRFGLQERSLPSERHSLPGVWICQ